MEGCPSYFVGIDWANDKHDVCVLDATSAQKAAFSIAHTAEGLSDLLRRLKRCGEPEELPIAIERPSGLLVDTLVEAGFPVVPIHPNALKATRSRYSAAPGKSDPGDAYILADVLCTDGHRFRPLRAPSDPTRALRAAVRTRGCDHPHAIRILARAWVRVLCRCWQHQTSYHIANHGEALPFLNQQTNTTSAAA